MRRSPWDAWSKRSDDMLNYDPKIRIVGEMKPNEPMDQAMPVSGSLHGPRLSHVRSQTGRRVDRERSQHSRRARSGRRHGICHVASEAVWACISTIRTGSSTTRTRLSARRLRRAFNQVWVLERAKYYDIGVIGLDIKAMRTTKQADDTKHLANSIAMFHHLLAFSGAASTRLRSKRFDRSSTTKGSSGKSSSICSASNDSRRNWAHGASVAGAHSLTFRLSTRQSSMSVGTSSSSAS